MQHYFSYIITALCTSLFWYIIFSFKIDKMVIALNTSINAYNSLLSQYEILRNTTNYTSPRTAPQPNISAQARAFAALGLAYGASAQEVKNKYRVLMKKYHPDLNKSKDAITKFKAINEAYNSLKRYNQ